ncbi:MFS transporter [Asaia sp. As-1742]|uniref:MFS transporter n=1 Tax=Asaia sp. As-1742 TaxID=2608325 RepID=UPI001963377B|nr:MFS transporter [Asaia sp. As-1742]
MRPAPSPRRTIPILAIAAGLAVGNVYAAQPLLGSMSESLGIDPAVIGLVVALTQLGYWLGLIFIVPLGDHIDRRRLILAQGLITTLALSVVAMARTETMLFAGMIAIGLMAVVAQVLVAFAAALVPPDQRGRAVGMVTTGIVIGILCARFVAGALADLGGWRAVYVASAILTLAMVGLMARTLPRRRTSGSGEGYAATLRSVPLLFLHDRVLLVRGLLAFLVFASFSAFWTALVLPLGAPPFGYSHTEIGLFGLVGIAGALAASAAGRLADRGLAQRVTGLALTLLLASWGPIALLPHSIPALVAGVILLDFAVQAAHVSSQSIILARHPEVGSRLIGGYMTFYSAGSGLGAIGATTMYAHAGWSGVSVLGALFGLTGLLLWGFTRTSVTPPPERQPRS